jgi:pyruvate dehydrogenase E1 component alpha subunit
MDVVAVRDAARRAFDGIRAGAGPHLLEMRTYRFRAHSMYDPDLYRDKAEIELWKLRDPVAGFRARCVESGILDDEACDALDANAVATVDAAVSFAAAGTLEPVEELLRFVTSEQP